MVKVIPTKLLHIPTDFGIQVVYVMRSNDSAHPEFIQPKRKRKTKQQSRIERKEEEMKEG